MSDNQNAVVKSNLTSEIQQVNYVEKAQKYLSLSGQQIPANQMQTFIELCSALQLNPFKREIYAVTYNGQTNIITGYEVYLKRAERTGKLNGIKVRFETEGNDVKCVVEISRKDWSMPFVHEVYMSEYNTHQALWKNKPRTMLRKVAMSQAYRMCFPDEMGGMPYTQEELPIADIKTTIVTNANGEEYEIYDEKTAQRPQPTQPQADDIQICNELKTQLMTMAKNKVLTENDLQLLSNGINNPKYGKTDFEKMKTWLSKKADKQSA